jgi:asparagine synthase (glutamine-hydrolysing)
MCGICGVVAARGVGTGLTEAQALAMRDRLTHRGPDGAGLFIADDDRHPTAALGHRRLSIIDPSDAGHQPMTTPDGRFVLVYNGELYNDAETRDALRAEGVVFRSECDTETVLHATARWGTRACQRLRGMYAFALWDTQRAVLTLARDGFGMKPLYWSRAGERVVFASEIPALLAHPGIRAQPDPAAVSGYISTIRTTLDDRTLYEGVRTLRPGEWLSIDCSEGETRIDRSWPAQPEIDPSLGLAAVVRRSVHAHLRSDVPWCSLLSGGLDSTILASIAAGEAGALKTYVSGCPDADDGLADDFAFADLAADAIGTTHTRVPVDRDAFLERWPEMVRLLGVPLSTPNEVAINAVARRLRADGHPVTLSGEGADELFAGYELPLMTATRHVQSAPDGDERIDAAAGLNAAAWMTSESKWLFLTDALRDGADGDAPLARWSEQMHTDALREAREDGDTADDARVRAFLGVQRRVNLVGLLQRLDTATMLESVEGRTPFADAAVLAAARRTRWKDLFREGDPPGTKLALRDAFRDAVPAPIAERPKRSFPLPFQGWVADALPGLLATGFLREVYRPEAIELVGADPLRHWNLAWPMANLALWGEQFG